MDPIHHVGGLDPARTLLMHARHDEVVRYDHGTTLWEKAGRPERVTLPTGHYSAVYLIPYVSSRAYEWLTAP